MRDFDGILCWFVCSRVLVLGDVWFLVEVIAFISVVFTFVQVGVIAKLSSVGDMYRVGVSVGALRVQRRFVVWWVLGGVRDVSYVQGCLMWYCV